MTMALSSQIMERISARVYREYPELRGVAPSLTTQSGGGGRTQYALTYRGKVRTQSGAVLPRQVRVVADERGQILRISTSK
ncbi:MAG: hypothetical protein ABSG98_03390 [Anaerolineales bacterium]|jgi:hypothetical protein